MRSALTAIGFILVAIVFYILWTNLSARIIAIESDTGSYIYSEPDSADVIDRSVGDVGKSLNSLHGPDFSVSSAETMKAEEQAYEDAYEHALKKASLLAAKQGRKVRVPAAWIREGDHYDGGPPPGPRMMRAFGGGEKTPVMAGEGSAVTRSITACFELQDAEA